MDSYICNSRLLFGLENIRPRLEVPKILKRRPLRQLKDKENDEVGNGGQEGKRERERETEKQTRRTGGRKKKEN